MIQEIKLSVMFKCQTLSNLSDFNDTYILVKCNITIARNISAQVVFKYCAPFINCNTKIDGTTIGNAKDLDLVMPIYNLI